MLKILILDAKTFGKNLNFSGFSRFGKVKIFQKTGEAQKIKRIKNADIIITNKVILDKKTLDNALQLKLIAIFATGTNNVDLKYAKQKGIAVTNVAGYATKSVAQHTFSMLLYLLGKTRYYDEYVKSGKYAKNDNFTHFGRTIQEISGKMYGIIGLGNIGKEVAKIAQAFGAKVIYYSTSGKNRNAKYKCVSMNELLKTSDILSIHAPLNEKTRNLITYKELTSMKRSAILLNLGRGGIVNEKDLARALDENLISAAGLDVLEKEPIMPDNPLLKIQNPERLLITPHIAWASNESQATLLHEVILNIEAFLKGEKRNRIA